MTTKTNIALAQQKLEELLLPLGRQKVILDYDVAKLYGVATRDVNKAVKNNPKKFLKGYVIPLNNNDLRRLRWKISTANLSKKRSPPNAFTEKGLYMLATILKSKQATKASLQNTETYVKLSEFSHDLNQTSPKKRTQKTTIHEDNTRNNSLGRP